MRVSAKERALITEFARKNEISVSEAVRSLLKDSFYYMKRGAMGGGNGKGPDIQEETLTTKKEEQSQTKV